MHRLILSWLRLAWANAWRNRRRSAVTVLIAALGTAALLLAGGFALATYQALAEAAARDTGHLVLARPAAFDGDEDVPLQQGLDDWTALRRALLADPAVRQVLPRIHFGGLIGNGDKTVAMMAIGIAPDAEFSIKGPFLSLRAGRVLGDGDREQVMLGEGLARSLKARPGQPLTLLVSTADGALNALDVTLAGIVATGVAEVDQRLVYTDVATAQRLLASPRVSSVGVFLDRLEATDTVQARLQPRWPQLAVRRWIDQAPFYRSVHDLYDRIFGSLGLIIAVIVVVVVGNAVAMAVVERTREIGTLRALGALPGQLVRGFALEGLVLGGLGALAGAALAAAVSLALLVWPLQMPPPPGRSVGYPLMVALDAPLYLLTVSGVTALVVAAAAWVAQRRMRLPLVDALGHV